MKILMLRIAVVFFVVIAGPVYAQLGHAPALYRVTGVASNDTLNIRVLPNAGSEIIGAFAPDKQNVEVIDISPDGKWGLVNVEGQSGWSFGRFLRLMPRQPANDLPANMVCSGTEPFWSLEFGPFDTAHGNWSFMGLTSGVTNYNSIWTGAPVNRTRNAFGFDFPHSHLSASGIIQTARCSDGMSDLQYGFSIGIILRTPSDRRLLNGCCSLATPEF